MADENAVGVDAAPKVFGEFEVLVDFLNVGSALGLGRPGQGGGRAVRLDVFVEVIGQRVDQGDHHGRCDDNAGSNLRRARDGLQEVEYEFVGAILDQHAGRKRASGHLFRDASCDGLVVERLAENRGTAFFFSAGTLAPFRGLWLIRLHHEARLKSKMW